MTIQPFGLIHPEVRKEAVMGIRIGYARVSSRGQKLDVQLDRLARSVVDLANIGKRLQRKNVDLVVFDQ